jgi:phage terminase large subunit-like protein
VSRKTSSRNLRNSETNDYVAIAIAYAEDAIADRKHQNYNVWIRAAAKRFIHDLKRTQRKRPSFTFSAAQACRACAFIEQLPHVEGTWETETIRLEAAHIFFLVNLFGFRNHDGFRRFTAALFAVARKNAKSTLAAGILIYCLCCEPEIGPQIISAATTGSQARIVFNIAKRMVERSPDLRSVFDVEVFANAVARYENGGSMKPINAKASTQDGLNPSHASLDEIHAHKNHDLLNVIRSAAGARRAPLFLYTTTEGYENPGPWGELRTFAFHVLRRVVKADHFLALYYGLDDEDDDFDEARWIKANPLMHVNPILVSEIRKEAIEAKAMPGRLAEFRIKRLNRRAAAASAWVNLRRWRECCAPVDLKKLRGLPCWGGLDLAATTDMVAWALLFYDEEKQHYYVHVRYWVPEEAVHSRTERRSVPYAGWVQQGLVTLIPGDTIDYDVIEAQLLSDYEEFQPSVIAYDPWNSTAMTNNLTNQGLPMTAFIQGAKSYNPAMKAAEMAYMDRNLSHGGNPVLLWNVCNVVPIHDTNMNIRPDRKRSPDKIDGACAMFMAFGVAQVADANANAAGFFESPVRA